MNIEWIRNFCLSLPSATENVQWQHDLLFKVGGKMFAATALEPSDDWLSFKCTPEEFASLTEREGVLPSKYLARAHWVSVESEDALPRDEIKRLVGKSYQLVFEKLPKKLQAELKEAKQHTPARRKR
jgi:predicted DNA-binding protein (MmcQ/YjbR family)